MALITNTDSLLVNAGIVYADLDGHEQSILNGLVGSVQTFLEGYLNRKLETATFTSEKLDGTGFNSVFVKNPPITTLTTVVLRITDTDTTTYGPNYFEFEADTGEIEFSLYNITTSDTEVLLNKFPRGRKNLLVTYNGGLGNYDVKKAASEIVIAGYSEGLGGDPVFEKLGSYAYKQQGDVSGGRNYPKFDEVAVNALRKIQMYKIRKA